MIVVVTILSMLLLGVIAMLIRYYPSYKWNNTCRALFVHFENGVLDNLHNLIDTVGPDLNVMFQTSCLDEIDREIKKFKTKHNSWTIDDECISLNTQRYKTDILNHIMRNKHKNEK